jgi:hypothetical protein
MSYWTSDLKLPSLRSMEWFDFGKIVENKNFVNFEAS